MLVHCSAVQSKAVQCSASRVRLRLEAARTLSCDLHWDSVALQTRGPSAALRTTATRATGSPQQVALFRLLVFLPPASRFQSCFQSCFRLARRSPRRPNRPNQQAGSIICQPWSTFVANRRALSSAKTNTGSPTDHWLACSCSVQSRNKPETEDSCRPENNEQFRPTLLHFAL